MSAADRRARPGPASACSRYPLPVERLPEDERATEDYWSAVERTLARLRQIPGRPAAMAAFDELMGPAGRADALSRERRPVVGTLCNFVPEALIVAAGAVPLRLDLGHALATDIGGRAVPADVCPEVKALVGAQIGRLPWFERADLVVVPTACDGKKKLARVLGEQRPVHVMELPQRRETRAASEQWQDQVRQLARAVARLPGAQRMRRTPLRRAIELLNRRTELARRLNRLRGADPPGLSGRDAFLVFHASFVADPAWWVDHAEALVAELEQREPDRGGAGVRLLLTGSPVLFPDYQLLHTIEQAGAVVVADEMCSGTQRLHNPVVLDESTVGGMLRAAAESTLLPCTCPCFVGSDRRIDRVLELCRESGARGVVHHTLRLCQLFDMELPRLTAALRERGLPLLNLDVDGFTSEGSATLRNRVEAFVEMIDLGDSPWTDGSQSPGA